MQNGKPSSTAILVGRAVLYALSDPANRGLMPTEVLPLQADLMSKVIDRQKFMKRIKNPKVRTMVDRLEEKLYPGLILHFLLRKRRIEEFARAAVADGARQLVVFGSGFDTLALRLARENPGLTFFELDHPSTMAAKKTSGVRFPPNLHLISVDVHNQTFSDTLLRQDAYSQSQRTFFVAEGLTMYLLEEEIDDLFIFVAKHSGPRSQIAFTFLEKGLDGKAQFPEHSFVVDLYLKLKHEEFEWGIAAENIHDFLHERELSLIDLDDAQAIRVAALGRKANSGPRVKAEFLAVAERSLAGAW